MRLRTPFALAALALALMVAPLRAQDGPDGAKVFLSGAASLQNVTKLAEALGVPLPPFMSAEGLAEQFGFLNINKDGIDLAQPIGVVMFAGPDLPPEQGTVVAVPVKAGQAPLRRLIDEAGGKPVGDDTVTLENSAQVRRTEGHVLLASKPGLVGTVDLKPWARIAEGNLLASARIDLKALRTAAPRQYAGMLPAADPDMDAGDALGAKILRSLVDAIDNVELAMAGDAKNIHLEAVVRPCPMPAVAGGFIRPALPAKTLIQLHLVHVGQSRQWLDKTITDVIDAAAKDGEFDDMAAEGVQPAKVKAVMTEFIKLAVLADATSLSISMDGEGEPVIHIAHQYKDGFDLVAAAEKAAANVNALNPDEKAVKVTAANIGGVKSLTLRIGDDDDSPTIEVVSSGKLGRIAIAASPSGLADLVKADAAGNADALGRMLDVTVDLGAVLSNFMGMGDDDDDAPKVDGVVRIQGTTDGERLRLYLVFPSQALKPILQLVALVGAPPAGHDGGMHEDPGPVRPKPLPEPMPIQPGD